MSVVIPDTVLQAARLSKQELLLEIAAMLYAREKLTLAQASHLCGMGRYAFQHLLASRGQEIHFDEEDLELDLKTLSKLRRA